MKSIRRFHGRKHELIQIKNSLEQNRNVIVRGSYGIGKSRLAFEAIKDLLPNVLQFDFNLPLSKLRKSLHQQVGRLGIRPIVVVLNNIFSLSAQKTNFIRLLASRDYLFIAIAESGIAPRDLLRLRCALTPHELLDLKYLSTSETLNFLRDLNTKYNSKKSEAELGALSRLLKGHPLSLINFFNCFERTIKPALKI